MIKNRKNITSIETAKVLVLKDGQSIRFVPLEFRTAEVCTIALKSAKSAWQAEFILHYIPSTLKTKDHCLIEIKESGNTIKLFENPTDNGRDFFYSKTK